MQRTTKIVLTLLLAVALAGLIVPAALSQGMHQRSDGKGRGGWAPDEMYHVIKVTGTSGTAVDFDILGTAIKGKDGKVAVVTMETPRNGTYYFANDTAVIPFGNKTMNKTDRKHGRPVMGDYGNATINVAGASAVIAMKNVTMTGQGRGDFGMQFTNMGVYLPDGTVKTYPLASPAKVMKSADNSSMLIVGNPSVRTALQSVLPGDATFPANAQPVMLKTVDGIK